MIGAKAGAILLLWRSIALTADLAVLSEFDIIDVTFVMFNIPAYLIWGAIGGATVGGYVGFWEVANYHVVK